MSDKELAKARARQRRLEAKLDIHTIGVQTLRFMRDSLASPTPATQEQVEEIAATHRTLVRHVAQLERERERPVSGGRRSAESRIAKRAETLDAAASAYLGLCNDNPIRRHTLADIEQRARVTIPKSMTLAEISARACELRRKLVKK